MKNSFGDISVCGALDEDSGEFEYWCKPDDPHFEGWKGQMTVCGFKVVEMKIWELALYLAKPPRSKKKMH